MLAGLGVSLIEAVHGGLADPDQLVPQEVSDDDKYWALFTITMVKKVLLENPQQLLNITCIPSHNSP